MSKQLVVIGGGAAGFFCAVNAARMNRHLKVTLIEKTNKLLSKVKISGGGRCNVTHACFDIAEMSRKYPRGQHFVKKSFHQFFTNDTIKWFEERGVKLKIETDGRMFPVTDSSQTIINCLLNEANKYGVEIMMNAEVKSISFSDGKFQINFTDSRLLTPDSICIACGGYPKSSMFDWIKTTGHTIEAPVPSLFTFNLPTGQAGLPSHPITKLMGVSTEAKVKIINTKLEERGPVLITHWGLSGPAILRLSAWGARELSEKHWEFGARVNWLPEQDEQSFAKELQCCRISLASQKIFNKKPFGLPQRLWEFLLETSQINKETRWADLPAKEQNALARHVCSFEITVNGKTTFKEEFVTCGGIKLNEVDPNTMMSKKIPGLYFAGEILDVDAITGGFNFQHAWTSGFVAAKSIAV